MESDALFQLGMGPVALEATQTEDHSSVRTARLRNALFRSEKTEAVRFAGLFWPRPGARLRGNSTKALILPA